MSVTSDPFLPDRPGRHPQEVFYNPDNRMGKPTPEVIVTISKDWLIDTQDVMYDHLSGEPSRLIVVRNVRVHEIQRLILMIHDAHISFSFVCLQKSKLDRKKNVNSVGYEGIRTDCEPFHRGDDYWDYPRLMTDEEDKKDREMSATLKKWQGKPFRFHSHPTSEHLHNDIV